MACDFSFGLSFERDQFFSALNPVLSVRARSLKKNGEGGDFSQILLGWSEGTTKLNQGDISSLYAEETYTYVHPPLLRNIAFPPEPSVLK